MDPSPSQKRARPGLPGWKPAWVTASPFLRCRSAGWFADDALPKPDRKLLEAKTELQRRERVGVGNLGDVFLQGLVAGAPLQVGVALGASQLDDRGRIAERSKEELEQTQVPNLGGLPRGLPEPASNLAAPGGGDAEPAAAAASRLLHLPEQTRLYQPAWLRVQLGVRKRPEIANRALDELFEVV